MDVSRAKTVIIVLLILLNVFLLANNLIFNDSHTVSRETLANAGLILEQRGIKLECDIPVNAGYSHRLEYEKGGLDRESIAARLLNENYEVKGDSVYFNSSGEVVFSGETRFVYNGIKIVSVKKSDIDKSKATEAVYRFMEDNGLIDGKYVLDKFEKKDDGSSVLYYIEKYENQLLFDNYFIVELSSNGVTRLEHQKYRIKGFSAENIEQPEAYQTLLSYFKNENDIVITGIDNGYKLMDEVSDDTSAVIEPLPVWRVMIKGETEPIYIDPHDISL
jgi:regulatory protein YycI of two-component signal transduction system YycFG